MFDLGYSELLLVAIVALLVVGPKDLPKLMRAAGKMMAKVRGTARHFKAGMDEMVRQAELDEMREKWDAHNAAIMARTSDDGPAARQMRGGEPPNAEPAAGNAADAPGGADLGEPTVMPPASSAEGRAAGGDAENTAENKAR